MKISKAGRAVMFAAGGLSLVLAAPVLAQMAGGAGAGAGQAGRPMQGGAMQGGAMQGGPRGATSKDPATVPAGRYELDGTHSQVIASVDHMGFSSTLVYFKTVSGSLNYDPAKPEASTVDVSINPASLDTGHAERDDRLRGPMFFDVAQFPAATYKGTSLRKIDANHATVNGVLTLHGVSKPVALDVTFNGVGKGMMGDARIGLSARATFKRSDFGMSGFSPVVGDTVNLVIEIEAAKK